MTLLVDCSKGEVHACTRYMFATLGATRRDCASETQASAHTLPDRRKSLDRLQPML